MLFPHRLPVAACMLGLGLSYPLVFQRAIAQTSLPVCPAPSSQEYLLLVRGNTEEDRDRIASVLPAESTVLICNYLDEALVRAGGFTSLETANAWATYMNTVEGFESFVARPVAEQPVTEAPITEAPITELPTVEAPVMEQPDPELSITELPDPATTAPDGQSDANSTAPAAENEGTGSYEPQRLAAGYAVLVDFGNRPAVASTVSQIITPVGLGVYQQRPYLLADYTQDAAVAEATLRRLSEAQLSAVVVDAEDVVQLSIDVVR